MPRQIPFTRARAFRHLGFSAWLAGSALMPLAQAAVVTVNTPFINLENRAVNSLGFGAGEFLRIGAVSVVPNGANGTTGVGRHLLPDGTTVARTINFAPSPVIPNFFSRLFADAPELRGSWDLSFTNGSDTTTRTVFIDPLAQQVKFVNSITLSGSTATPTFSWTPPPGTTVNAYRINIYDRSLIRPGNSGQVMSRDLNPGITSYTVNPADFTVPGFGFQLGRNYSIEIGVIQTKDGTTRSSNDNLQAISRTYADFTPNTGGGPPVNLPVVLNNGAFQFNMSVVPGITYYIDPEVAVGYDYAIGAGNPLFTSVDLPDAIGDGLYDIYGFDGNGQAVLLAKDWLGTQVYDFGASGVERFRVLGIELSANLDPANVTAFITGLTFSGAGQFTGTQTPITVTVPGAVPEPATLLLALTALGTLGALGADGGRRRPQQGVPRLSGRAGRAASAGSAGAAFNGRPRRATRAPRAVHSGTRRAPCRRPAARWLRRP